MNRLICIVVGLMTGILAFAQAEIEIDGHLPDVNISVKRCMRVNGSAILDLVFTNNGSKDFRANWNCNLHVPTLIDDEGVEYKYVPGQVSPYWEGGINRDEIYPNIQSGITKRFRCYIPNLDEYATFFQLVDLRFTYRDGPTGVLHSVGIRIRNVPIK